MSSDRYLTERLPWYLNGSLDEAESAEVKALLAESAENRAEWAETRAAAKIYGHRLPSEVLVAYAFDGEHPDIPTELIERYLAVSPVGNEELRLVRDSRADLERDTENRETKSSETPTFQPQVAVEPTARPDAGWRRMALAASLIGVTALGLAGWQWFAVQNSENQLATVEQQLRDALASEKTPIGDDALIQRIESLEEANQQLAAGKSDLVDQVELQSERIQQLDGQVAEFSAPLLNIPVVDVFPGDMVLRGDETPADRRVIVPRETRTVTLILNSAIESDQAVTGMQILAADGSRVWRSAGQPERDDHGTFTVAIPVQTLDSGIYTLQLVESSDGQTQVVETYQVEIQ